MFGVRRPRVSNCHADLLALHAKKIALPASKYDELRTKRNKVRIIIKRRLREMGFPVYRVTTRPFGAPAIELASSSWKPADPAGVTAWFQGANARSPGVLGGRQLARMVRYLKVWTRSRSAWQGYMPSGFAITALAVECYKPFPERDDRALLHLLTAIFERLQYQTAIAHPVMRGEFIVRPDKDATARCLLWGLDQALSRLGPIAEGCPREQALARWDGFFNEEFLRRRPPVTFI